MGKSKRVPRKKLIKTVDILKPVDIFSFGSEDDPCFGKLYDPRTAECSRCGDSDLCAMKMSVINQTARGKLESKQAFKDIEERDIKPKPTEKGDIRKRIKSRIKELIRLAGKIGIKDTAVINDIFSTYSKDGSTKTKITKILKVVISKSTHIEYNQKEKLTWIK